MVAEDLDDISAVFSYAHGQGPRRRLPRRRHLAQRPGAGRGHPRRRTPALERASRCSTTAPAPGSGRAPPCCAPTPPWPGTAGCSGPIRPARIACTLGGVVANNASGHDGRHHPQLLPDARLAHPRPAVAARSWTPPDPDADAELAHAEPALCAGLLALKAEIEADRGAGRPDPRQVRDQEHQRLPPGRLPRRRDTGRDPARADGRLRGHPRLPRRDRLRHPAAGPAHLQRAAVLPHADRRGRGRARASTRRARGPWS